MNTDNIIKIDLITKKIDIFMNNRKEKLKLQKIKNVKYKKI